MLSPSKFYRMLQEIELDPILKVSNELFQLPTVPDVHICLDNSERTKTVPTIAAYSEKTRNLYYFPKWFVRLFPKYIKLYQKYLPEFRPIDLARRTVIHEVQNKMHHASYNYESTDDIGVVRYAVSVGICEAIALYAEKYAMQRLDLRRLWQSTISVFKDIAKESLEIVKASDDAEERIGKSLATITLYYFDKLTSERDDFYRKFVRQNPTVHVEERIVQMFLSKPELQL